MITYLTIFNQGYVEFTMNNIVNYITTFKTIDSELILTAVDDSSYTLINEYLKTLSKENDIESIKLKYDNIGHKSFAEFNTPAFINIVHKKINVLFNQLDKSEIVHFFDSDVVFFKDPANLIKQKLETNDIVFQQDQPYTYHHDLYHNYVCSGNFSIKNTDNSKQFLKEVIYRLNPNQNDQEVIYSYLNSTCNNIREYSKCNLDVYNPELFQNGYDAFKSNWYLKPEKISIHANHMVGKQPKMDALKKANAWFI